MEFARVRAEKDSGVHVNIVDDSSEDLRLAAAAGGEGRDASVGARGRRRDGEEDARRRQVETGGGRVN